MALHKHERTVKHAAHTKNDVKDAGILHNTVAPETVSTIDSLYNFV